MLITLKKTILFFFTFFVFNAHALDFKGKFIQGHYIIGNTDPKSKIWIDKKKVKISDDGYFVFGISRDRKYDIVITIKKDGEVKKIIKKVQKRKYQIQKIDGLPQKKVTPPKEV